VEGKCTEHRTSVSYLENHMCLYKVVCKTPMIPSLYVALNFVQGKHEIVVRIFSSNTDQWKWYHQMVNVNFPSRAEYKFTSAEAQLSQLEESKGSMPVCDLGEFSRDYRHTCSMERKNLEDKRETERG